MLRLLFAPFAPFLELDFALNFFAVLFTPIVNTLAVSAGQFYKVIL